MMIPDGELAPALKAAAREMGVLEDCLFTGVGRRARVLAGAAFRRVHGASARAMAAPLAIASTELAPSLLKRAGITEALIARVADALGDPAAPVAVIEDVIAPPDSLVERIVSPSVAPPAPVTGNILRAPALAKRLRDDYLARGGKPIAPAADVAIVRLKPVTREVARYAAWFLAADWDLVEVADLFGRHPDALADALAFGAAA